MESEGNKSVPFSFQGMVALQIPNSLYGLHLAPAATSTVLLGPGPGDKLKANPSTRYRVAGLPITASKRLLAAASLYQSRAVPEFFPLPVHALRTNALMLKLSPVRNVTPAEGVSEIVFSL